MSLNVTEFAWTPRSERAAVLVAQDTETDVMIAHGLGVAVRTLERWKKSPVFRERVAEHVAAAVAALKAKGIAERQNRLDDYNSRWEALHTIASERAADPATRRGPGGSTGYVVRQVKLVKVYTSSRSAEDAEEGESDQPENLESAKVYVEQEEFPVDTGLLKALADLEKQASIELGQWEEKQVHTGGVRITVEYEDGAKT